jgi:hypothetical protein
MVNHLIGSESDFPCFDKAREGRGDLGPESDAAAALVLEAVELLHNLLPALRTEERLRLHYGEVNLLERHQIIRRFDERSLFFY